jgi:hypothetical protein
MQTLVAARSVLVMFTKYDKASSNYSDNGDEGLDPQPEGNSS